MEKFFNTAGPNQPDIHYTLSPVQRVDWPELLHWMTAQKYFILHAPRQTGKTSLPINLMHHLNAEWHVSSSLVHGNDCTQKWCRHRAARLGFMGCNT